MVGYLLSALPLRIDEWRRQCSSAHNEWAKNAFREGDNADDAFRRLEGQLVHLENLINRIASGGVVCNRLTIETARRAFQNADIVVFVAHRRNHVLAESHILEASSAASKICSEDSDDAKFLRELLGFDTLDELTRLLRDSPEDEKKIRALLHASLNEVIMDQYLADEDFSRYDGIDIYRQEANRDVIDKLLRPFIRSGNSVEFSDAMLPDEEFLKLVPETYAGYVDLTLCHSVLLADKLRLRRPKCVCISGLEEKSPGIVLPLILATFDLMRKTKLSYLDASIKVRKIIRDLK